MGGGEGHLITVSSGWPAAAVGDGGRPLLSNGSPGQRLATWTAVGLENVPSRQVDAIVAFTDVSLRPRIRPGYRASATMQAVSGASTRASRSPISRESTFSVRRLCMVRWNRRIE